MSDCIAAATMVTASGAEAALRRPCRNRVKFSRNSHMSRRSESTMPTSMPAWPSRGRPRMRGQTSCCRASRTATIHRSQVGKASGLATPSMYSSARRVEQSTQWMHTSCISSTAHLQAPMSNTACGISSTSSTPARDDDEAIGGDGGGGGGGGHRVPMSGTACGTSSTSATPARDDDEGIGMLFAGSGAMGRLDHGAIGSMEVPI